MLIGIAHPDSFANRIPQFSATISPKSGDAYLSSA
jgi:hypothetical protein